MRPIHYWTFAALLLLFSVLFGYHKTTFYQPQSTHTWRQSDCASFALNYYQYNRFITHPRLHNRQEADGYMVGEFPGLYYLAGQLYRVFGVHAFIPRFLNLLLFWAGLLAVFRFTFDTTRSLFFAYIVPLLLFSAPVVTYYANNFLVDISALSLMFVAYALALRYSATEKLWLLYAAGAAFALGGLLKVTFMIGAIALGGLYALEVFGWVQFQEDGRKLFPHPWHTLGMFVGVVAIVAAWYLFSAHYNEVHGSSYFLSKPVAPWMIDDMGKFPYTLYRILYFWAGYYFFMPTLYLIIGLLFMVFLGKRYPGHYLFGLALLTFLGSFMLLQLFYYQFMDHDYYVIPGYLFVVTILCAGVAILKQYYPQVYQSWILKVIVIGFLGVNVWHAKASLHDRYEGKLSYQPNEHLYQADFKDFLDNLGISKNDLVVSVPDISPNTTLYLMNRPGFTEWVSPAAQPLEAHHVQDYVNRGASYLIVHDPAYLERDAIKDFLGYEMATYKNIKIFDLKRYQQR